MTEKIRILFLAANSGEKPRRRVEEEAREIEHRLRASSQRESFHFNTKWAVRAGDLQQALMEYRPHILHFSGRGSRTGGILLAVDSERPRPVDSKALARLLKILNTSANARLSTRLPLPEVPSKMISLVRLP